MVNQAFRIKIAYQSEEKKKEAEPHEQKRKLERGLLENLIKIGEVNK